MRTSETTGATPATRASPAIAAAASRQLEDRVLGCMPVTSPAFSKLLGLLSIEASDEVPSACVTTGARSCLLINPAFVARHCRSDEHLAMLVLHELYHVLLGHTRLYPRVTPAQNWAFDCLINAQLCRLFPHPKYVSFFGQLVRSHRGPARLLAPPGGWVAGADWRTGMATARSSASEDSGGGEMRLLQRELHWRLYDDDSVTATELYRLLGNLGCDPAGDGAMPLLGDHRPGAGQDLHPEVLREVREIVARWPMVERRGGRDQGGTLGRDRMSPGERRQRAVAVLRRAIAFAAGTGNTGLARRMDDMPVEVGSPVDGGHDRRAWLQRWLGAEPLVFASELATRTATPVERVRVYLDVSGSMDVVLPPLYAALSGCLGAVEPVIYGFSTAIGPLSHVQLREGVRLTTGGTEIAAVTGHLLGTGARRAIVVTDGWVGTIPDDHAASLRRRRIRLAVIVTESGDPSFAARSRLPVFRLPELP